MAVLMQYFRHWIAQMFIYFYHLHFHSSSLCTFHFEIRAYAPLHRLYIFVCWLFSMFVVFDVLFLLWKNYDLTQTWKIVCGVVSLTFLYVFLFRRFYMPQSSPVWFSWTKYPNMPMKTWERKAIHKKQRCLP